MWAYKLYTLLYAVKFIKMKQKPIRVKEEKVYQDIEYQVSTFEGNPIMEVMTIQEQKDIEMVEGLSVSDVIDMNISSYRDWQCDC